MPTLRAPDGEVAEVSDAEAQHYLGLGVGFELVRAGTPSLGPPPRNIPFPGDPQSGMLEDPGLIDLVDLPAMFFSPGAAANVAVRMGRGVASAARAAGGPMGLLKSAGRAALGSNLDRTRELAKIVPPALRTMLGRRAFGEAAEAVPAVADDVAAQVVGGPDADAAARLLERATRAPAGRPAISVRPSSPVAQAAPEAVPQAMPEGFKQATDYWRKRTMALMTEAGAPAEAEAQRKLISEIVGRDVKSRTSLTIPEWMRVTEEMTKRIGEQASERAAKAAAQKAVEKATKVAEAAASKAAKQAAPKVVKTPGKKVAGKIKPAAPPKVPRKGGASMEDQLQQSIALEQEMTRLGIPPEVRMAARRDPTILEQLLGGLE